MRNNTVVLPNAIPDSDEGNETKPIEKNAMKKVAFQLPKTALTETNAQNSESPTKRLTNSDNAACDSKQMPVPDYVLEEIQQRNAKIYRQVLMASEMQRLAEQAKLPKLNNLPQSRTQMPEKPKTHWMLRLFCCCCSASDDGSKNQNRKYSDMRLS